MVKLFVNTGSLLDDVLKSSLFITMKKRALGVLCCNCFFLTIMMFITIIISCVK